MWLAGLKLPCNDSCLKQHRTYHLRWGKAVLSSPPPSFYFIFFSLVQNSGMNLTKWNQKSIFVVGEWIWSSSLVCLSCKHSPLSSTLVPTHPLLSAQWKSLITGGESNPWHWMKDEGPPPSLSFSQPFSLPSFFPRMLVMLGRFSPPFSLIFPLPLSPTLSFSFPFLTPLLPLFAPNFLPVCVG